ncbi:ankyrin repeat domain-containing protein [Chloroflexota bacterium]
MLDRAKFGITAMILVILPTLVACSPGALCMPLLDAINQDNVDVVRDHIESDTDLNKMFIWTGREFAGASALHLAVSLEHKEIAELLLNNGANINIRARDQYGGTPLHWAAFLGHKQMAEMLVEAGADINVLDKTGNTPLDAVMSNPDLDPKIKTDIEDYLRKNGAKTKN